MLLAFKIVSSESLHVCQHCARDRNFDLSLKFLACSSAG